MGRNSSPTGMAGTRTVYPSSLPAGEPDYLSNLVNIRPKEAQHSYFGPSLSNHINSMYVPRTLVHFLLPTSAATSTSRCTPALWTLVPVRRESRRPTLCPSLPQRLNPPLLVRSLPFSPISRASPRPTQTPCPVPLAPSPRRTQMASVVRCFLSSLAGLQRGSRQARKLRLHLHP
jgi:hypothetical protein